ncbi:hypothetical protein [Xenorhabdus doucetiae]|nr:hypothetical protein [Xenorhabdus doucetiae]
MNAVWRVKSVCFPDSPSLLFHPIWQKPNVIVSHLLVVLSVLTDKTLS